MPSTRQKMLKKQQKDYLPTQAELSLKRELLAIEIADFMNNGPTQEDINSYAHS